MTDKTSGDNVIEFTIDNRQLYFVLGAVSDAYNQLNDLAKREFINTLKNKTERSEPGNAQALQQYIDGLMELSQHDK